MNKIALSIIICLTFWTSQAQTPSEVVDSFFEALNSKDHQKISELCLKNTQLHSLNISDEAKVSTQSLTDFLESIKSIPEETRIFEEIISQKSILTEHLAQFTLPYAFYINDKLSHTGSNIMTLLKTKEGWKISYIADTRIKP